MTNQHIQKLSDHVSEIAKSCERLMKLSSELMIGYPVESAHICGLVKIIINTNGCLLDIAKEQLQMSGPDDLKEVL